MPVTLSTDLLQMLQHWLKVDATPEQQARWPQEKALRRDQLCASTADCVTLGDDYPIYPIFDCSWNNARCFWYTDEDRRWPSDKSLIEFGVFEHLEVERIVALPLKNQFESFFKKRAPWRQAGKESFEQAFEQLEKDARDLLFEFQLSRAQNGKYQDVAGLYAAFEALDGYASKAGYGRLEDFEALIQEYILTGTFLHGLFSPEVDLFVSSQQAERAALGQADDEAQREFTILKLDWTAKRHELEQELGKVAHQRRENARYQQPWYAEFGDAFLALLECNLEVDSLTRRIELKRLHEEMTHEEVCDLEMEQIERANRELGHRRRDIEDSKACAQAPDSGGGLVSLTGSEATDYQKRVKRLLVKIHFKTHNDYIDRQTEFTDAQRDRLKELFREAKRVDFRELKATIEDVERLESILSLAEVIWETMGVDVDERDIVRGETLAERTEWLRREIKWLSRDIANLGADHLALQGDTEVARMRAAMASEESRVAQHQRLADQLAEGESVRSNLEREYASLFGVAAA